MRVVHVSEHDIAGGAGKAALRLHEGLLQAGVDSKMFIKSRRSQSQGVVSSDSKFDTTLRFPLTPYLDRLPIVGYRGRSHTDVFSNNWIGSKILKQVLALEPDIINLHWVNSATLSVFEIAKINIPVVWTMHDMWSVTGGCHYDFGCGKYKTTCGKCPILASQFKYDVSTVSQRLKQRLWKNKRFSIVTPSQWLKRVVVESNMFSAASLSVIPYGLDLELYRPHDRQSVREVLGLAPDTIYILFGGAVGTTDRRKGYSLLLDALRLAHAQCAGKKVSILTFGHKGHQAFHADIPYPVHSLGHFSNDLPLSLIYAAADIFVLPTLQDNLPNTVIEALACGTPTVAFDVGGIPDMVSHKHNGYLAEAENVLELAEGLSLLINDAALRAEYGLNARESVLAKYKLLLQAERYKSLYKSLLPELG